MLTAGQSDTVMEPSHDRQHLWAHRSRKPSPDRRGVLSASRSLPAPDSGDRSCWSMSALSAPDAAFARGLHWRDRLSPASCAARTTLNATGSGKPSVNRRFPRPGELVRTRARDDSGVSHVGEDVRRSDETDRLGVASPGARADSEGDLVSRGNDTRITRAESTGGVVVVVGCVSNGDGATDSFDRMVTHSGGSKSAENLAKSSDQTRGSLRPQQLSRRHKLMYVNKSWPSTCASR